ncbi:MAG: biosynthetic peptidoglycan transglycosylase [Polyangiaceae bacterium]
MAVTGFAPLVRYEAAAAGARVGAQIRIDRVWPTWHGALLRGVDVTLTDVPSAAVHADEIEIAFGSSGRTITVRGGDVRATGPRDEIATQVEAWRAKNVRAPSSGSGEGSSTSHDEIDVGGFSVRWQDRAEAPKEAISATGVRVDRTADKLDVVAETASLRQGSTAITLAQAKLRVHKGDKGYRVDELSLGKLDGAVMLDPPDDAGSAPALVPTSSASATVAPIASASSRPSRKPTKTGTPAQAPSDSGPAWERRAQKAAEALVAAARQVDAVLEDGATVAIERVHAEIRRGDDTLHVGPGKLAVTRDAGRLAVELAPWVDGANKGASDKGASDKGASDKGASDKAPSGEQQALTFRLLVPVREDAASQEIVGDVKGGPIWLSTLGIKDGDFGLFDVQKGALSMNAKVTLSGDRNKLRLEGDGRVSSVSLQNKSLSDEPIAGLDLAWRAKATFRLDRRRVEVDEGEVDLGQIRLVGSGTYERIGDEHQVRAAFELPLVGCQAALDSMPKGLVAKIAGMRMAGTFALKGKASFDTARLDHDYQVSWDTAVSCRVTEAPAGIDVSRFTHAFEHTVYTPDGTPKQVETGPGTGVWVPYGGISKFMTTAVLTTEDGGFYRHRGFDAEAIRNSIRENLRKRKFVRGASTISMQLAKNIYLDRTKNLSRKLQEAVLTMYLEQVLTKDQILELYLNVIEFGPMVYGVGPAAQYYFHGDAGQLSLGQALYLSSILPNPKADHFTAQGPVSASWMSFLHKLMEIAHKRDRITDEELEDGLRETVVRGSPAPFRAPKPAETTGGDSANPPEPPDDSGWTAP